MVKLDATKNVLKVRALEPLTSNSVNVNQVQFTFNSAWNGLSKTAVFRAGAVSISVILDDNSCLIPWEVLQKAGVAVEVGVYGTLGEEIVLPTIWAEIGMVKEGAKLGENAQEPTPDVYQQFVASVKGDADRADAAAKDAKASEDWVRESREAAAASAMASRSSAEAASQSASASIQAADRAEEASGTAVQAAEDAGRSAAKAEGSAQKAEAASAETSQKITELDQAKLDKPPAPPSAGNVLKVLSVNEDGTFVCEWADASSGGVTDVTVNGESIVSDGVATLPVASVKNYGGIIRVKYAKGFVSDAEGFLEAYNDNYYISNRYQGRPLELGHLDYGVKAAMCDGKGAAWTAEEQAAARERMGIPESGVQSDWSQNDENAPDYVKNRPFYDASTVTTIIPESTVTFIHNEVGFISVYPESFDLVEGQEYSVSWDGTDYVCTGIVMNGAPVLGNIGISGFGNDTGEPFVFVFNGEWIVVSTENATEHIIGISAYDNQIVKIDAKFLPDDAPYKVPIVIKRDIRKLSDDEKEQINNAFNSGSLILYEYNPDERGVYSVITYFYFNKSSSLLKFTYFSGEYISYYDSSVSESIYSNELSYEGIRQTVKYEAINILQSDPLKYFVLTSSTSGSTKKFKITVDDDGALSTSEVTG